MSKQWEGYNKGAIDEVAEREAEAIATQRFYGNMARKSGKKRRGIQEIAEEARTAAVNCVFVPEGRPKFFREQGKRLEAKKGPSRVVRIWFKKPG